MQSFDWGYVASLLIDPDFWVACLVVVIMSVLAWTSATVLGLLLALVRESKWSFARRIAGGYVWLFRSMPLLVLIVLVYNMPQVIPSLQPVLSNPFWAGLVALVLSETAYIAEIHRGALLSVGSDQREAAKALGITYSNSMLRIVIPQAFRIALPTLGNELVSIVKLTSLVSVISLAEILTTGERLYTQNFKVLETLVGVSIYYVLLVSLFNVLQSRVERKIDVRRRKTKLVDVAVDESVPPRGSRPERKVRERNAGNLVVKARGVTKTFADVKAVSNVDLDVHLGEVVAIVGSSGSGKSTFLRTLNVLEEADEGVIEIAGERMGERHDPKDSRANGSPRLTVTAQRRRVGMVFQQFNLFPHLSVIDNLMLAPRLAGDDDKQKLHQRCVSLLGKVGLRQFENRYPHQLSGGQQQRVAIARALATKPKVMLFDEPTSALDPELVGEVLNTMTELADEGMTMVVVTHEMRFVSQVADWVVLMDHGEVVEQGYPNVLMNEPRDERTARFFSTVNQDV